ncbi:MAG: prepilin peptidase [Candidatus Staskawiczbacteria bacterium]|nr:prepilin peptidase [Candidatus Staskawiczbacteria bacterium]
MFISYIISFFVFLFGVCIGSFLNCLIYRLEEEKSLKGRSFCPHCKHTLFWYDLFPVLSFLFLRGKCRYCKAKISLQYPLVELAAGIIFLLISNFEFRISNQIEIFQFLNLAFLFYIASSLIVIFVYDLKHYLIPDKVLFPAIVISLIYNLTNWQNILNVFIALIIAAGFFLFIFLISKGRWMGFGDVKLAVLMGLLLGFPNILTALFLAFFFGAIIGIILMVFEKKGLKSEIPFGPFLIAGTFLALLYGSQIIQWYLNFFQI